MALISRKNQRKISIAYLLPLLTAGLLTSAANAQMVRVQAVLDSNTIDIGGQVTLTLTVEKPRESVVEFPSLNDTLCGSVEILSKGEIDSTENRKDDRITCKQQLIITAFDTGLLYIDPIPFIFRSGSFVDTIHSAPNYLEVLSFPVDSTNNIRDIKALYKAPLTFREVIPWVLAAAIAGLLVWFLVSYYKKKKRNEPLIVRVKPLEAPDVIALRELERLKAEKLWQQGRIKEYYSRLSDIVRTYLEGRYKIMALEQTSFEILISVNDLLGKDDNYHLLKTLLELADLVKFAKAVPEPDEHMMQLENATMFIMKTRPLPESDTVIPDAQTEVKTTAMKPQVE